MSQAAHRTTHLSTQFNLYLPNSFSGLLDEDPAINCHHFVNYRVLGEELTGAAGEPFYCSRFGSRSNGRTGPVYC
ncbi:MAG TPA: hypothetical protein DIV39_13035 [Verrucomicrobiales bacterium]|nr:hypothetical protein [Verrucomicrobiales bacterium]